MKNLRQISIKKKLILIQLLTTFTVLLLYSVFHIVRDTRFYLNSVKSELTSMTELFGSSCASALHFIDREAAVDILSNLKAEEYVANAWIHDADGGPFAEYKKPGYRDFDLIKPSGDMLTLQNNFMIISKPVVDDKETIGFVSIRYDMKGYNKIIFKNIAISLIIFLIGMVTAWLLAIFTQRTISNPILTLLGSMKRISETGDFSIRPPKERDDEIGTLSDGIGEMLDQIRIRENEKNTINAELHESEEKYRNLVERANDGIVILQNGLFKYVNPSLVEMAGSSEDELLGSPFTDFIHEEETAKVADNYRRRMAGEAVQTMYETRFKTNRGKSVDAEVNAGFITYQGKPADLVIIRNITERKQIEQELKKHKERLEEMVADRTAKLATANERLLELDRMKSMFLASMSHELRTPLNSIIGFSGILMMGMAGELNPEQKKQLEMVRGSADHLLELINDILDISKIESGKVTLSIETFDLKDIAREVMTSIQPLAQNKGLQLSIEGVKAIRVESDRRRIKQILMNLVGNSVKFTDKGFIKIDVESLDDRAARVEVSDTGIGINEEELGKLFNPFQQLDMTSTKKFEGTGLGLYLSKKLLTLLHGDISVSSRYGKGSAFTFVLPLHWQEESGNEKGADR